MKTDGERIAVLVHYLANWMQANGLGFPFGYSQSTFELWATAKVLSYHRVKGLDLDVMEQVNVGHLGHDINGICLYWDTWLDEMQDCFEPRCARREEVNG